MFRFIPAAAVCVAATLVSLTAQARDYQDPAGRFKVTVPDGWQSVRPNNAANLTIVLARKKSAAAPFDGVCIGIYFDVTETKSKTQQEVNSLFDGRLTPKFWRDALSGTGETDLNVKSAGNREKDGRSIHNVIFTSTRSANGTMETATGKMEVQFIPGSMHTLTCIAETASWNLASAEFEDIFYSYEPSTPALIASLAPGGSVLTMFAGDRYDGVARVLSQDTPNLPAEGWISTAGSLLVDGAGAWQVCDGVNYSGTCRTVSFGQSAESGKLIAVTSARRVGGPDVAMSAVGTALRRSMAEFVRTGSHR